MSNDKQARVYALDERQLPQEQMAVVFAMTSRSPDPFDEIARRVSEEKAADFHERWVLDYGHASVAEHAVVHLAVENISRVACDTLENNRLASYTEKSSRYQVIGQGDFHAPEELEPGSELLKLYTRVCNRLFREYENLLSHSMEWLGRKHEREEKETKQAYNLRMRRMATDACRNVLPASILTNVGVTANARTLEHAISKLMSSETQRDQGAGTRDKGTGTQHNPDPDQVRQREPPAQGEADNRAA